MTTIVTMTAPSGGFGPHGDRWAVRFRYDAALVELLGCAETVLAATGNAVALCPTYGMDTRDTVAAP